MLSSIRKNEPEASDENKYLGLELEFDVKERPFPLEKLRDGLNRFCEHNPIMADSRWRIDNESTGLSVNRPSSSYAGELAGLMRQDLNWPDQIREITNFIQSVGGFVDEGLGLHVHLDARFWDRYLINKNLSKLVPSIEQFCSERRLRERVFGIGLYIDRGHYNTVEVRFMEANFDHERITKYINFLIENGYKEPDKVTQNA